MVNSSVEPRVVRVTMCSSCPFDSSDCMSRSQDHCRLLGVDSPGGGFRVPPEECPLRTGVQFELDLEEAQKRYDSWVDRERRRYRESLRNLLREEEESPNPNKKLVRELKQTLKNLAPQMAD